VSACLQCKEEFTPGPRRGKPQVYCGKPCQTRAANARRATTRTGRIQGITNPHSGLPSSPEATTIPPSDSRALSDSPSPADRLSELIAKAHSKVGVTAWEIATIAKLRGVSAWAPLSVILAKEVRK
jgi:hypothetical protein